LCVANEKTHRRESQWEKSWEYVLNVSQKQFFLLSAVCVFAFWGQQTNGKNNAKKGRDKERKREFPKLIKTS